VSQANGDDLFASTQKQVRDSLLLQGAVADIAVFFSDFTLIVLHLLQPHTEPSKGMEYEIQIQLASRAPSKKSRQNGGRSITSDPNETRKSNAFHGNVRVRERQCPE